jgi:hypothetical protein
LGVPPYVQRCAFIKPAKGGLFVYRTYLNDLNSRLKNLTGKTNRIRGASIERLEYPDQKHYFRSPNAMC